MKFRLILVFWAMFFANANSFASHILIPMDATQTNHLKSYGIAYWALAKNIEVKWLLNYKGGSFMCQYADFIQKEL
ncbi:MAG: asparagine synthetase B, partial [Verrucomicrobia bacterium]|nr:asparagine synthetase B [Cytophagales bacterium]